ncbi:MAG: LysM peptidoglycan-binding domain-containing protein [Prevotellaceae bacterium]|jgi:LysM repeat protein|nr:LysM peptidoglycan-binding domain-containing protein [Prevotellaceae bacterium]
MKRKMLKYLLPFALLLFVFSAFSQVEIKKSTEKIRIGDNIYYVHLVKQGETIYSLCRVYGVSQDELISINPQLSQGLKANQRLKIPDKTESKSEIAKTVKNETKITADANKKNEIDTKNIDSETTPSAIKHKVKSGDDIESIAKKYNCSVESILKYNAFLNQKTKLKKGQYLTVYPNDNAIENENIVENTTPQDTIITENKELFDVDCNANLYSDDTLNVVLLLPMKTAIINDNQIKNQRNSYDFIEFYEGFLLAIDSLKRNNISVNIKTFDVNDAKTLTALDSTVFETAQLVIGNISKTMMSAFTKIANQYKVPIVSTFSHETENIASENKYFIQAFTPLELQTEKLNKILCDCNADENIVIIYEKITDSIGYNNFLKSLKNCEKQTNTYKYILKSYNDGLKNVLKKDTKNNIFVTSNSNVFVMDVLSKLNALSISMKCDITVYGSSRWKTFESSLNFDYIHNLNLTTIQPFFVDYNRAEVKNFIAKYRYYYKGDPSSFSFQGYDLGLYFVDKLSKYGNNFIDCITNEEVSTLLQTRFKFSKTKPQSGLVNTESLLLRNTKDFSVVVE